MKSFAVLLGSLAYVALLAYGQASGEKREWKVFSNRAGWSVGYPADWTIASCHSCPDPTAPGVFVDFFPPHDRDSGWVMIEQLADRPAKRSIDEWLKELKQTDNLNPRLQERKLTVGGLPALEVRYRNPSDDGLEVGAVYIVSGSQSFAITFSGKPGVTLEQLGNYRTYTRMVETFRVKQ